MYIHICTCTYVYKYVGKYVTCWEYRAAYSPLLTVVAWSVAGLGGRFRSSSISILTSWTSLSLHGRTSTTWFSTSQRCQRNKTVCAVQDTPWAQRTTLTQSPCHRQYIHMQHLEHTAVCNMHLSECQPHRRTRCVP